MHYVFCLYRAYDSTLTDWRVKNCVSLFTYLLTHTYTHAYIYIYIYIYLYDYYIFTNLYIFLFIHFTKTFIKSDVKAFEGLIWLATPALTYCP